MPYLVQRHSPVFMHSLATWIIACLHAGHVTHISWSKPKTNHIWKTKPAAAFISAVSTCSSLLVELLYPLSYCSLHSLRFLLQSAMVYFLGLVSWNYAYSICQWYVCRVLMCLTQGGWLFPESLCLRFREQNLRSLNNHLYDNDFILLMIMFLAMLIWSYTQL